MNWFLQITERQVAAFKEECELFYTRFIEQGPGSVGEDLKLGEISDHPG